MIRQQAKAAEMRKFLTTIYNETGRKEELDKFSDEEVLELAENLKNGVPFAIAGVRWRARRGNPSHARPGLSGRRRQAPRTTPSKNQVTHV